MSDADVMPPCHGLIAAWRLAPGASPQPLDADSAPVALAEASIWLHFDLLDARARAFILALAPLPLAARLSLVEPEEAVRLDVAEQTLFGCIPDIHYDADTNETPPIGLLHVALTARLLVTARRHPLRGVHTGLKAPEAEQPAEALAAVLRATGREFGQGIARLAARTARIEDALLRPHAGPPGESLAAVQREALRLARQLEPLAEALDELDEEPPGWLVAHGQGLVRERRRLRHAVRALAGIRERSRIAQDQAAAQATEETNRRLLVLSVISAAMLPASLVAGIFGMNVSGVPGVAGEGLSHDWGFVMAMALITASVGGVLAALRLFRLL